MPRRRPMAWMTDGGAVDVMALLAGSDGTRATPSSRPADPSGRSGARGVPVGGAAEILLATALAAAIVLGQRPLPAPDRRRGDLDELLGGDELDRRFERQRPRRRQPQGLVVGVRPDVGELLLLRRVHVHVARSGVLPDDHPLVDILARPDQELGPLLE